MNVPPGLNEHDFPVRYGELIIEKWIKARRIFPLGCSFKNAFGGCFSGIKDDRYDEAHLVIKNDVFQDDWGMFDYFMEYCKKEKLLSYHKIGGTRYLIQDISPDFAWKINFVQFIHIIFRRGITQELIPIISCFGCSNFYVNFSFLLTLV